MRGKFRLWTSMLFAMLFLSETTYAADLCLIKFEPNEHYAEGLLGGKWLRDHGGYYATKQSVLGAPGEGPVIAQLKWAADHGDPKAQYVYAKVLHHEAFHCSHVSARPPSTMESIKFYLMQSSDAGYLEAKFALTKIWWNEGDIEAAFAYFKSQANKGDAFAEIFEGRALECGRGVPVNKKAALRSYKSALSHTVLIDPYDPEGYSDLSEVAKAGIARNEDPSRLVSALKQDCRLLYYAYQ